MNSDFYQQIKSLVRIQSTADDYDARLKTILFVRDFFADTIFHCEVFESNQVPSIVISNHKTKNFDVILNGHTDVVPASAEFYDVFNVGDHLRGRGVCDMKGFVLAMMSVFKKSIQDGRIDYPIALMITTDEEVGGENGVGYLLEKQNYTAKVVIIPDGGKRINAIELANKGYMNLNLTANGRSAHGARPWLGENAIEKLIGALTEIKSIFEPPNKNIWRATCNLGLIKGGSAPNAVPDRAEACLDIRYTKFDWWEDIEKRVLAIAEKHGMSVERSQLGSCFEIDADNPLILAYKRSIEKYNDERIEFIKSEGASDAQHFATHGIPAIIHQSDCGDLHTKTEWLDVKSLDKYILVLEDFLIDEYPRLKTLKK